MKITITCPECGDQFSYYNYTSKRCRKCHLLWLASNRTRKKERLYRIWCCMKNRCHNANNYSYKFYGGRGIFVCEQWRNDYEAFKSWSLAFGYTELTTIDRIDNSIGYTSENCRWVSKSVQAQNKSRNTPPQVVQSIKQLLADGVKQSEICIRFGIGKHTVSKIKLGKTFK